MPDALVLAGGRPDPALRERMAALRPLGVSLSGTGPAVYAMAANEAAATEICGALAAMPDVEVFLTRTFSEER